MSDKEKPLSRTSPEKQRGKEAHSIAVEVPRRVYYTTQNVVKQPKHLPGFDPCLAQCSRRALGAIGEITAADLLQWAEYDVSNRRRCGGDITAIHRKTGEISIVEVKTARRAKDGKWRFTLWKKDHTDHRKSDYVMLLAIWADANYSLFVIPVSVLETHKSIAISSFPEDYAGQWSQYRIKPNEFIKRGLEH